jgi:hypothetical protein
MVKRKYRQLVCANQDVNVYLDFLTKQLERRNFPARIFLFA